MGLPVEQRHSYTARSVIDSWLARINESIVTIQAAGAVAHPFYRPAQGIELRRLIAASLPSLKFTVPRITQPLDCAKVIVQTHGNAVLRTRADEIRVGDGEWMINDFSRTIDVELSPDCEQLLLIFPPDFFFRKRRLAADDTFAVFGRTPGVGRIAGNFIDLLLREWPSLSPAEKTDLVDSAAQMMQSAIIEREVARRPTTSMGETLRERVKAYVLRHLRDHCLSIDRISSALGVTNRYLHKLFQDEEETLNAYIWSRRLERCAADLSDPGKAETSITEIAFSWGFNNSGHFSRQFKQRYGICARSFRNTKRNELAAPEMVG